MATQLKITLVRGTVGRAGSSVKPLRTLGLKKIRQSVVREDTRRPAG